MDGVPRGHLPGANKETELAAALRQAEAELGQQKLVQEELQNLVAALELRIGQLGAELAASKQKLRLEDVTRVDDQKEIRRLRENLVQRENAFALVNRELESLTYGISHDLRAPLRHLIGFSGALLEDYRDSLDPTARGYLDCVERAGRKIDSLIGALFNLSRISRQELTERSLDLGEIARPLAASLQESAPARKVVFTVAAELPVLADQQLMNLALANLIGNAWKYTSRRDTSIIELGRKEEGNSCVYYLRDNGVGFDMRYAGKLFSPFQRMHSEAEFEGAGVGLAIVQRIIHRHGGRIWADAAVDQGATFFFTLPQRSALDL